MKFSHLLFSVLLLFVISLPGKLSAQIYADVTVSGGVSGTFTITLEDVKAPITVANFIGLATGQKGWLDLQTGAIRYDPFYNGVTFHRVIAGFMSQTGSRNGNGTDGPGYTFRDEIDPSLTHQPYIVSMANSGPDTNGSQWFVTQGARSNLNGIHTIFGVVSDLDSQAVCTAINAVTTDSSDKPVTPVTISSITVRGPSLAGFNVNSTGLPRVLSGNPVMKVEGSTHLLGFDFEPYSEYIGAHTTDLVSWSTLFSSTPYVHFAEAGPGNIDVASLATGSKHFYRLARVDYSSCFNTSTPSSFVGKTLIFPGLFGKDYVSVTIDASGNSGTYQYLTSGVVSGGSLVDFSWQIVPYSAFLYVKLSDNTEIAFDILNFMTPNSGKVTGRSSWPGYGSFSGTFTSSP